MGIVGFRRVSILRLCFFVNSGLVGLGVGFWGFFCGENLLCFIVVSFIFFLCVFVYLIVFWVFDVILFIFKFLGFFVGEGCVVCRVFVIFLFFSEWLVVIEYGFCVSFF